MDWHLELAVQRHRRSVHCIRRCRRSQSHTAGGNKKKNTKEPPHSPLAPRGKNPHQEDEECGGGATDQGELRRGRAEEGIEIGEWDMEEEEQRRQDGDAPTPRVAVSASTMKWIVVGWARLTLMGHAKQKKKKN